MRPTRTPDLPLHKGGQNGRKNLGSSLNNALEKGLDLAGLSKTKTGSGDKERAYIVRQNGVLKFLLFIIAFCTLAMVGVFSTYLEINISRRQAIHSEALHRKLEHSAQLKLMSVHMQLQKALDNEVHETVRIEEYRSQIAKIFGQMISEAESVLNSEGVSQEIREQIGRVHEAASFTSTEIVDVLVKQFRGKSERAKKRLKDIAGQIIEDIDEEEKEKEKFKERLHELGASDDFDYDGAIGDEELEEFGIKHERNSKGEEIDEDEIAVENDLERFYKRLLDTKFSDVLPDIIKQWEERLENVIATLEDDQKETDLAGFENYVQEQLLKYVPKARQFDPKKDRSIIDFFEAKIYEARIAPHKQFLMDMHDGWKKGSLSPYQVLASIEKVANDENLYLIYEWLNGFDDEEDFYEEDM